MPAFRSFELFDTMNSERSFGLIAAYVVLALCWMWSSVASVLIPVPVNVVVSATCIVYIGCHRSLRLLISEEHGGVASADKEVLSSSDAYKFPIIGSVVLFGLYMIYKHFKEYADIIMAVYFSVIGVYTMTNVFSEFFSQFYSTERRFGFVRTFPLVGEVKFMLTGLEYICLVLAAIFSAFYFKTKHYLLSNLLGISFCIQSIERMSIGSFKVGSILLIGLFFYDIFWVFGSEVMVSVAKNFDGPVKILFMRSLPTLEDPVPKFSLLGLGDIVIPGLFIALLLRLDAVRANIPITVATPNASFFKPYFNTNIVAYMIGLSATLTAMYAYNVGQPALLYIVPSCLLGAIFAGFSRGELSVLFAYNEEVSESADMKSGARNTDNKKVQ